LLNIEEVFTLLLKDQWLLKRSKCSFAQREVAYLGHIISDAGVGIDPIKIDDVRKWQSPANVKELRQF
jgi:hypothetical protein